MKKDRLQFWVDKLEELEDETTCPPENPESQDTETNIASSYGGPDRLKPPNRNTAVAIHKERVAETRRYRKESELSRYIATRLKKVGIFFIKVNDASTSGVPDFLICLHGGLVGLEIKQTPNTPSKLQEEMIQRINDAGGYATVCYNWGEVKWAIHEAQRRMIESGKIRAEDEISL